MSRSRYAALPLLLALSAGTACVSDLSGIDVCTHSEGCDSNGGWGIEFDIPLGINGIVTSATTGEPIAGVSVRVDFPARAWSEGVLTDSTGRYPTVGLTSPKAGDCAGLSFSFSKDGYQPLQVTEFPGLNCAGYFQLNASLTPSP